MRKSWKETRLRLYNTSSQRSRLNKILRIVRRESIESIGDGSLTIAPKLRQRKNAKNRSKQLYTHTGGSKSFARRMEEEKRIEEIEQQDESSRVLSQNDSIAQVFRKEKPGRVRGVGFGPTPSQLFGPNSHASGNGIQLEETQRKLLELQAKLEGEKLKRKAMEDEAAAKKKKMKAMDSALIYLFQRQGEELPLDIAAGMSFVE
ncbi:uncharacterized protein LOC130963389 [Arachis stenosperma]|uniref:uncharacterized protein LOC130963389 n=1 Tax=Arachis stenosperma TaxID=217475 RepID=UPI0025AB7704|nr:uncharacterized protein LOC130963389 [Arachis stenosperma]